MGKLNREGGWSWLSIDTVGANGNISAVELNWKKCMDGIDKDHKTSMSEVSKMLTLLREDLEASQRFNGRLGSAREHSRFLIGRRGGMLPSGGYRPRADTWQKED